MLCLLFVIHFCYVLHKQSVLAQLIVNINKSCCINEILMIPINQPICCLKTAFTPLYFAVITNMSELVVTP